MSTGPLLLGLATLILVVLIRPLLSPLRSVPGPFAARWTDLWYLLSLARGNFERRNRELHETYGPIVRYGPNRYSVNDPSAAKIIYGHGPQFAKSSWYSSWASPGAWALFADQHIKRHAHNRSLFQSTYSMTALVSYESYVDECADLFGQRLREIAETAAPIDMRHWFQCYAFDVIGLITYAKRFGFLDRGEDVGGVIGTLEGHLFYATTVGVYPSLHPFLSRLRNYFAGEKGAGRTYMLNFTQEQIASNLASRKDCDSDEIDHGIDGDGPESFLDKFMAKHAQDPEKFTHQHIVASCVSNIVAGSDTTAISLSASLYYLLKHPECHQRLRTEIDTFQSLGKLSERPTFKETQQMPYLQAVLKEALRMHPATGLPLERVVPEQGVTIAGRHFPSGTIIGVNTWVEHSNPAIFGDDAHLFRPERWQTKDSEELSRMNRHWMPFGLGSRTCIGRHISMLEMTKLIPRIVRDFDFELVSGVSQSWPTQNVWFVKPTDFMVKVTPRQR